MKGFERIRSVILWSLVLCALYVFPSRAAVYVLDPASAPDGLEVGPASPSDAIVPSLLIPGFMTAACLLRSSAICAALRPGSGPGPTMYCSASPSTYTTWYTGLIWRFPGSGSWGPDLIISHMIRVTTRLMKAMKGILV